MSESLARLVEALALGEGFQLGLLVVPDLAAADACAGALQRQLSARLGRPALLTRICPDPEMVEPEALTTAALDPLASLAPSDGVILDASAATARSEPAWIEVFRRLNTRRNGFARQLGRTLVLCLTPRLEELLAREAPDLWSVRGPRAAQERTDRGEARNADGLRYEDALESGLPDGLKRIFASPRAALPLLAELGYPPARLPLSDAADFWPQVLRALDQGRLPGGIETLVRRLARDFGDEPSLRRAIDRLPRRVKVDAGWVRGARRNTEGSQGSGWFVELPWVEELREVLRGPPGQRVAIVGRRGSGRSTGWKRALADVRRENPWVVDTGSESRVLDLGAPFWANTAAIPALKGTPWETVARAVAIGARPSSDALRVVPERVRRLLPKSVLDPLPAWFIVELAACLPEVSCGLLHVVQNFTLSKNDPTSDFNIFDFSIRVWTNTDSLTVGSDYTLIRSSSLLVTAPPHALTAIVPQVQRVIHVPPLAPEQLQTLLDRRLSQASPRDQLVLRAPETAAALGSLCDVAQTPAALLLWVARLLNAWPMPPPPEWLQRVELAKLVGTLAVPPERLLVLGELLDGPARPAARVAALLGQDIRPLLADSAPYVQVPLLERDERDPDLLTLSPEAALLRPSVAAALASHARP